MGSTGVLAGATEVGAADHVDEWPDPTDSYYALIASDLAEMGLPPADFVHGDSESVVRSQYWAGTEGFGTTERIDVSGDGVPFSEATRFEITDEPDDNWDVQMRTADWASDPYRSIDDGQVLLGVVYLRAPEGSGTAQYVADNGQSETWNAVVSDDYQELGDGWRRYYFPIEFDAAADGSAFEWTTQIHLGFGIQTVDVGGIALLDFGHDVDATALPAGPVDTEYEGGDDGDSPAGWPSPDDFYYAQLVRALEQSGLPPAQFVYGDSEETTAAAYDVYGSVESESLDVSGDDVTFSEAIRVEVGGEVDNPWEAGIIGEVQDRAVEAGDVLLGVAYLRAPDGAASIEYTAKDQDHENTNMVFDPEPSIGEEWERYFFPIQFDYSSEPDTWWTEAFLGYPDQTIDIGGLALLDFGAGVDPDELPSWASDHNIAESWEEAADQRIHDHRTGDLSIQVTTSDGRSLEGAQVAIDQQSHEFGFGTAVNAQTLLNETGEGDEYREYIPELFNTAVMENRHKWRFFEDDQQLADQATDWLIAQGLGLRGHACLWDNRSAGAVPEDVEDAIDDGDAEYVRERTLEHIEEIITHYGDDIEEWDVVNEAIHEPGMIESIDGEDVDPVEAPILADWYQQAREAAPDETTLAVNDYNTLSGPDEAVRSDYERQIEFLSGQDAGLDSIGLQCHFNEGSTLTPLEILGGLDQYAAHDVSLRITEFGMADEDWDDDDKADFFYEFLKTVFSHPDVDDFLMWGFWDGRHWRNDAPLFDEDWNPKPAYDVYTDLVFDEWWTETTGEVDDRGDYATTVFNGDYEITASYEDVQETVTATVSADGRSVNINLDHDADEDDDGADGEDENGDESDDENGTGPDTGTGDDESDGLPGFGVVTGLAGLSGLAGYALSRHTDEGDQ